MKIVIVLLLLLLLKSIFKCRAVKKTSRALYIKRYSVSGFGVKMSKVKVLTAMRRRFELYECLLVELTV